MSAKEKNRAEQEKNDLKSPGAPSTQGMPATVLKPLSQQIEEGTFGSTSDLYATSKHALQMLPNLLGRDGRDHPARAGLCSYPPANPPGGALESAAALGMGL